MIALQFAALALLVSVTLKSSNHLLIIDSMYGTGLINFYISIYLKANDVSSPE